MESSGNSLNIIVYSSSLLTKAVRSSSRETTQFSNQKFRFIEQRETFQLDKWRNGEKKQIKRAVDWTSRRFQHWQLPLSEAIDWRCVEMCVGSMRIWKKCSEEIQHTSCILKREIDLIKHRLLLLLFKCHTCNSPLSSVQFKFSDNNVVISNGLNKGNRESCKSFSRLRQDGKGD